ncbi:MAG: hypothetical protein BGO43_07455 [Gammaproteobacteria bacterium 39-13]|nr:phenylacetate--CoA ligase family protein [Gammaproteobacteria bacterium]OJV91411.1 MAG: hypothetical protein BGO43_07455 [Gammaproteobacteria bacterium 39-13]
MNPLHSFSSLVRSAVPRIMWPTVPHPMAAQLYYQLDSFSMSEKLSIEHLRQHQFEQLFVLFNFARQHVPYYQQKMADLPCINHPQVLAELWPELPLLTRSLLQQAGPSIFALEALPAHEPAELLSSSGSTGQPVTVKGNIATQFFWNAISLRNHLWHQDKFDKTFAAIRFTENKAAQPPFGTSYPHWSTATFPIVETGPCHHLTLCTAEEEARWLMQINPDYLNCNPSTLREITQYFAQLNQKPSRLKKVHTHSEIVEPQLRTLVQEVLGIPLIDTYSAKEVGYIALQCSENENYHIQAENLMVEILNDKNSPCQPGETGRVVITTLHNFSSPLIRYEIGDYAIVGEPCSCGRTLPVIKQILGRKRNILKMPDGRQVWPAFANNGLRLMDLFAGAQFQVIQKSLNEIHINLALIKPFSDVEENSLREKLITIFSHPFDFTFNYISHIPRSAGGKFEDFKCEI